MYAKGSDCYKSNWTVYLIIRFWMSNSTWLILQKLFWMSILVSCLIMQIAPFFTTSLERDNIMKDVPFISLSLIFIVKSGQFFLFRNTIRKLINVAYSNCNKLEDDHEYIIIKSCIDTVETFAIFLTLCVSPAFIGIGLFPLYPFVHDILVMSNETRPIELPIDLEYFVDQRKYFTFILIHLALYCITSYTVLVITETTVIILAQHSCAFFKICRGFVDSYRIQHAMDCYALPSAPGKPCMGSRKIIKAVEAYKLATEFIDHLNQYFAPCYTVKLVLFVPAISINLYRLSQAVLLLTSVQNLLVIMFILLGQFGYFFMSNHAGQTVINQTDEVFDYTYNSLWYIAPVADQKLLLGVMLRSMKPHIFKLVGGLHTPSYPGFATIVRLCVSYYMFMYSTQQDTQ